MRQKVSVCMTSYNGAAYIQEQLDTILGNLTEQDELIVSDDGSTDETEAILADYASRYENIRLLKNCHAHGVIGNFETALENARGDIVFLADQDDRWADNKVETVLSFFETHPDCILIVHNARVFLSSENRYDGTDVYGKLGFSDRIVKTIMHNTYIGCCMAFRRELLAGALPFPDYRKMHMHDLWLAICAMKVGRTAYIREHLIDYRIHDANQMGFHKTSLVFKVMKRLGLVQLLLTKTGSVKRRYNAYQETNK